MSFPVLVIDQECGPLEAGYAGAENDVRAHRHFGPIWTLPPCVMVSRVGGLTARAVPIEGTGRDGVLGPLEPEARPTAILGFPSAARPLIHSHARSLSRIGEPVFRGEGPRVSAIHH
jgi:hypothetical protein